MHKALVLLILLLAVIMHAGALVRITEFCPDPWMRDDADEYIVLSGSGPLDRFAISDNHGGFRFPPGTIVNGTVTIARNGLAYQQSHGSLPDFEWSDSSPDIRNVVGGDPLQLANTRDQLKLYDDQALVQEVSWPENVTPRQGQVHFIRNGQWDPRPLMLGQSRFAPEVFRNVTVTTFVSPDCSNEVFSEAMSNASREILLNMYEFSSPSMGSELATARARGAAVTVLIEGGPVGGISPQEKSLIDSVNRSGIPVYSMVSTKNDHAPYRYDHAKYVVLDRNSVFITSENFKYSGFPPEGKKGNRGWGTWLEDPALAGYFSKVFSADQSGKSVIPYSGGPGEVEIAPAEKRRAGFAPGRFDGATVTPVIAPDTSYLITDLIDGAQTSIEIEQAYIKNESPRTLNPFLAAAVNASRRGVHVRILLDSYWFNIEGPNDNDEMAATINRIAAAENLPLEAKCIDLATSQVDKIHNKGVIVDSRQVLISSINWNSNSPNFNREAGVIIDHPGVAGYFLSVYNDDWAPTFHAPAKETGTLKIVAALVVIGLLVLLWYRKSRA